MARNRKQFKAEVNRARYQLELTQKHVLSAKERAGALSQELARAEEERNVARVELDALRSSTSAFESDASGLREKVFALREEISTMEANHKCALDEVDATWKRALQYEMQESKSSMAHLVQSHGKEVAMIQADAQAVEQRLTKELLVAKKKIQEAEERVERAEDRAVKLAANAAACMLRYEEMKQTDNESHKNVEMRKKSVEDIQWFNDFVSSSSGRGAKTSAECISMAEDIIEERRRIDAAAKDAEEIKSEYLNKMLSMQESFRGQLRRVIKDCETERARKEDAEAKLAQG